MKNSMFSSFEEEESFIKSTNAGKQNAFFHKSSFCNGGACVAVAMQADGSVGVRDTKDKTLSTLTYTRDEWAAFVKGVKNNEFEVE